MKKFKIFGLAMLMLFQLMLPQTILAQTNVFLENFEGNVDRWTTNSAVAHGDVAFVNGQYAKSLDDTSVRMYSSNDGENNLTFSTGFDLGSKKDSDKYIHFSIEFLQENASSGIVIMLNNSQTRQYFPVIQTGRSWPRVVNFANFGLSLEQNIGVWNKADVYLEYGTNNVTVFLNGQKATGTAGDLVVGGVEGEFVAQDFISVSFYHEIFISDTEYIPSAVQFDNVVYERTSSIPDSQDYRYIGEVIDFDDGISKDIISNGAYNIQAYKDPLSRFQTSGNPAFKFAAPSNVAFNTGIGGYPQWNRSASFSKSVSWPSGMPEDIVYNTGVTDMGEGEYGHLSFMAMKNGNSTNPDIKAYIKSSTMQFSSGETVAENLTLFEVNDSSVKFLGETADASFASDRWYKIDIVFKNNNTGVLADCYIDGVKKLSDFEIKSDSVLNYIGDIHFTSGASPGFLSSATKNYTIDDLAFGVFDEATMCDISSGYSITTDDSLLKAAVNNEAKTLTLNEIYTIENLKQAANEQITAYDADGRIVEKGTLEGTTVKVSNGFGGGVWYDVEIIENNIVVKVNDVPCYEFFDGVISAEMSTGDNIPSGSTLVLAYYSSNGKLKKLATSAEDTDGTVTCSIGAVSNTKKGEYLKAYVWSSFAEMEPVCEAVTIPAAMQTVDESKYIYDLKDREADAVLSRFNAVNVNSGYISSNGELSECEALPEYQGDKLMLKKSDALKLFEGLAETENIISFSMPDNSEINIFEGDNTELTVSADNLSVTDFDIYINGEFYRNFDGTEALLDLAELNKAGSIEIMAYANDNEGRVAQKELNLILKDKQKKYIYKNDMSDITEGVFPSDMIGTYAGGYMKPVELDSQHGVSMALGSAPKYQTSGVNIWFGAKATTRTDITKATFECDIRYTGDLSESYIGTPQLATSSKSEVLWIMGFNGKTNVNGKTVAPDMWHHCKWILDLNTDSYKFLIDGYEVQPLNTPSVSAYDYITGQFRFTVLPVSGGTLEFLVDNIEYYEECEAPTVLSVTDNSEYINVTLSEEISGMSAQNIKLISENGEMEVSSVEADGAELEIYPEQEFMPNTKYYLVISDETLSKDIYYKFIASREQADGEEIVSLEDMALLYNKVITKTDTSTVLVGNSRAELSDEELLAVNARMIYTRPDKDMLKDLFINEHPRLYINTDKLNEVRDNYGVDTNITEWTDYIIARADSVLNKSPEAFVNNGYYDIMHLADRVRTKVMNLSFAYLITKDEDYAAKAWEEVANACEFETWNHNVHSLDSTTFLETMALAYDWLYGYLNDTQKAYIIERCHYHILDAVYKTYHGAISYDHEWATCDNNWNASCNRSVIQAATAFFETDSDFYSDLIMNALRCYENMLKCFYPSGAWREGPGYGLGTVSNITQAMSILNNSFGTDFNIKHTPQFDNAMDFYIGIAGTEGTNNFNDSDTSAGYTQACNFYLAKIYNKPSLAAARLYSYEQDNLTPSIYDVLFYDTSMKDAYIDMPLDSYYKGVEMVSMRSAYEDDTATFVSMHSGNNLEAEYHAHLDSGTFVVDMLGERFVKELGAENYENEGMNDIYRQPTENLITRWSYYMNRPEGHSCFVINPDFSAGQNIVSDDRIEKFESGENSAFAITTLSSAYQGYAKSAKRGIMLSDNRQTVTIRDEIKLNDGSNKVWWFMQTAPNTKIELIDENTAIITLNGKQVKVLLQTDAASFEMKEMASEYLTGVDPGGDRVGYYDVTTRGKKLAVEMTATGDLNIEVKLVPMGKSVSEELLNTSLASWSVAD